ncbi:MAG TPA: response regulator [Acidimicrobiales bacterium]|nr:response regulator [Acidimicrobiales bacterium]
MTDAAPPPSRRAVLVVDDDDCIRAVVRAVLEAGDFDVVEAVDGPSALQLLAAGDNDAAGGDAGAGQDQPPPDVLVLDVMMPGMDGIEVCRQVDHRTTRVLMLTAREDVAIRDASAAAGADAFLAKPFSAVELLDAIERLSSDAPGG